MKVPSSTAHGTRSSVLFLELSPLVVHHSMCVSSSAVNSFLLVLLAFLKVMVRAVHSRLKVVHGDLSHLLNLSCFDCTV